MFGQEILYILYIYDDAHKFLNQKRFIGIFDKDHIHQIIQDHKEELGLMGDPGYLENPLAYNFFMEYGFIEVYQLNEVAEENLAA